MDTATKVFFAFLFFMAVFSIYLAYKGGEMFHNDSAYEKCILQISTMEDVDLRLTVCDRIK